VRYLELRRRRRSYRRVSNVATSSSDARDSRNGAPSMWVLCPPREDYVNDSNCDSCWYIYILSRFKGYTSFFHPIFRRRARTRTASLFCRRFRSSTFVCSLVGSHRGAFISLAKGTRVLVFLCLPFFFCAPHRYRHKYRVTLHDVLLKIRSVDSVTVIYSLLFALSI